MSKNIVLQKEKETAGTTINKFNNAIDGLSPKGDAMNTTKCDMCEQEKTECPKCLARSQSRSDRAMDELKIDGFRSLEQRYIVEEMAEAYLYPDGRVSR